ncbi:MAG TPA: hypothetical protein VGG33_23875, partial [Polyangia bacterium]
YPPPPAAPPYPPPPAYPPGPAAPAPEAPPGYPPPGVPTPADPGPAVPPPAPLPRVGSGLTPVEERVYSMPSEPESTLDRRGFVLEVGMGAGGVFDEEEGFFGIGYDLAAGGAVSRELAGLFSYSTVTIGLGDGDRATHAVFGGALQYFFAQRFWVKAGAGIGQLSTKNTWGLTLDATERAFAAMFGLGVEVYQQSPNFALDLQLRTASAFYEEAGTIMNGTVMLGLNWY